MGHGIGASQAMLNLVTGRATGNIQRRIPQISFGALDIERQQRGPVRDIQHPGGIFGAFYMTRHPE